ncbi:EAL domain-containing protein [Paenibacillus oenotherae]|uniref:EAL domain-containing protein n=1 Tax=Paenibacillus oenotherae TaxID=1435645 RepID=A0ABS7D9N8_9BACL|nr:EAL domain-containing protein [Paenibacillus oenotherae]MBW7476657.1 EAL domain-containing protein [Paenibacillus oenotherae]
MRGNSRFSAAGSILRSEQGGPRGIIYLAWHGKAMDRIEVRSAIQCSWRSFAEQAIAEERQGSLYGASSMWMRDDLYVSLPIAGAGDNCMEEQLLELGSRFQQEWEQRFIISALGGELSDLQLHAGVSVVEEHGTAQEEDLWYEGMKRAIVHGQSAYAAQRSLKRRSLEEMISDRLITPVYQPIISLRNGTVYGYEALSRCPENRWFKGPEQLFSFASDEGMVYALDRLARERAIEGSAGLSSQQKLFINITAQIMNDPSFSPGQTLILLEQYGLSPTNVVFEITERSSIEDFGAAKKTLGHYRSQGYQIAIDDAGAGYSSLQSIVELEPDYIKIDRSLIRGIHRDPMKEHIVHTFIDLAAKMGVSLVAEGIETEAELAHMKAMGVHYAQGYLLGRPAFAVG